MITLKQLQDEHRIWSRENFGVSPSYQPLLGIMEEVGELSHAHLKSEQGIRGSQAEHYSAKIDAVGDIVIFLASYCTENNIDLETAVTSTWDDVKKRRYAKHG